MWDYDITKYNQKIIDKRVHKYERKIETELYTNNIHWSILKDKVIDDTERLYLLEKYYNKIKLNLLDKGIEVVYDGFRSILNFNLDNDVRDYEELFKDFLETYPKDIDYLYIELGYENNDKLIQVTSLMNKVVDYNRTYKNRIILTINHNNGQKQQFLG